MAILGGKRNCQTAQSRDSKHPEDQTSNRQTLYVYLLASNQATRLQLASTHMLAPGANANLGAAVRYISFALSLNIRAYLRGEEIPTRPQCF